MKYIWVIYLFKESSQETVCSCDSLETAEFKLLRIFQNARNKKIVENKQVATNYDINISYDGTISVKTAEGTYKTFSRPIKEFSDVVAD